MKKTAWIFFMLCVFVPQTAFGAAASLYDLFDGKAVKVYLAEVQDSTPDHKLNVSDVKPTLSKALANRKSIRFEIVEGKEQADLLIETEIRSFYWTDHDPVDMLMGIGGTAADAAIREDYARVEADFTVTDLRKNRVLWKDRVMATITKKPMSEAESIPLVTEDLAKVFIRECFGKKRK